MNHYKLIDRKVNISGRLTFDTAFHIGSGREGELATDMGVLLEPDGSPVLPGSSLKGCFRTFAERLAGHLDFTACLLDANLSGVDCVTDEPYRKKEYENYKEIKKEAEKIEWLDEHTCHICKLFGSPLQASRIFFSDGILISGGDPLAIRDGVCIDRDTETARHGAKYDFEVVPAGAVFEISIDLENPLDEELGLVGAVVAEWENGFRIGGFTSRGLGSVRLSDVTVRQVNYGDADQLKNYLLNREMTAADTLLSDELNKRLN